MLADKCADETITVIVVLVVVQCNVPSGGVRNHIMVDDVLLIHPTHPSMSIVRLDSIDFSSEMKG